MTDFEDWNKRKESQKKAHQKLVGRLKRTKQKPLNDVAEELHLSAFKKIDCLDCANCCTSIPPMLNKGDVSRISKHLGMKVPQFENQYLQRDEDGDWVMNTTPCPFLASDNKCDIYDVRPRACQQYPHTDNYQFIENLNLQATNARHCPAVFFILEEMLKKEF